MRMLQLGLRVTDLERSLDFYCALGYANLGVVPGTEFFGGEVACAKCSVGPGV